MTIAAAGTPQIRQCLDSGKAGQAILSRDDWDTALDASVILVVEDDWLLRQAILDELSAAGWRTREAESAQTALEILESGEDVDLLITDVALGGTLDGWEVAKRFRSNDPRFPVIYVSGNLPLDQRRVPGSVFLSKPCVMTKLLEACRMLMAERDNDPGAGLAS